MGYPVQVQVLLSASSQCDKKDASRFCPVNMRVCGLFGEFSGTSVYRRCHPRKIRFFHKKTPKRSRCLIIRRRLRFFCLRFLARRRNQWRRAGRPMRYDPWRGVPETPPAGYPLTGRKNEREAVRPPLVCCGLYIQALLTSNRSRNRDPTAW